jgi:hypothetical protein
MGQGFISKYILKDIADFIRAKKNTTDKIAPIDMVAELETLPSYEDGKQAEWSSIWDGIQNFGNRTEYDYAFRDKGWTDENFNPKYPIAPTKAERMFDGTGITDFTREGIVLDFSKVTWGRWAFANTQNTEIKLPTLDFSGLTVSAETFFRSWVKELSLITNEAFNFSNSFWGCKYLENLTINGVINSSIYLKDSNLLSAESVQGVIDCLKDLTGATAQTLTLHAAVGAKLTEAQKATITAKNWTLVY